VLLPLHARNSLLSVCHGVQNSWKEHPRTINPLQMASYPSDFQKLFQGPNCPKSGCMGISPREPALLDFKGAIFTVIGCSPNWGEARAMHTEAPSQ